MLFTWVADHNSTARSKALRFVQFMKNRSYHVGIKRSPYKALISSHPKVGLDVLTIPEAVLKTLRIEEDLDRVLSSSRTNGFL
jgi:transaldolase